MKHLVLPNGLHGDTIRPSDALERFHAAATRDAGSLLREVVSVECPACGGASERAFDREGFTFRECSDCESLFVSPRPTASAVARFYRDTEAGRLRVEYFRAADEDRLTHVVRSRVDWVANLSAGAAARRPRLVDVGTLYPSFLAEIRSQGVASVCQAVDVPLGLEAAVGKAGAEVGSEPAGAAADIVTAFEQLEHQASPRDYLSRLRGYLRPGGWLFATTRSVSGFDLLVLWDRAPYVFVPEHVNLLSVEGLQTLFEACGFEVVELSTPGRLDVELVEHSAREHGIELPRLIRYLLRHRGDQCRSDLQELLQRHRLSSHVRIAARARP